MEESPSTPENQNTEQQNPSEAIANDVASNPALQALSGLPGSEGLQEQIISDRTQAAEAQGSTDQPIVPDEGGDPIKAVNDILNQQVETPPVEETVEEPKTITADQVPEDFPESTTETETKEIKIESPIFGGELKQPGAEVTLNLEGLGDLTKVNTLLSSEFGVKDLNELRSQMSSLKEGGTELGEMKTQVEQYNELFTNMPKALYDATLAWQKGGDWQKSISNAGAIDFTKDIANHSDEALLKADGASFDEEQWEEYKDEDGDLNLKLAIDTSIAKAKVGYTTKQHAIAQETQRITDHADVTQRKVTQSIEDTVRHMSTSIEGVDAKFAESVGKDLQGGINSPAIFGLFFNKDGSFKEDAAERFAYASHGKGLVNQYKNKIETEARNKATEEVLLRTSQVPPNGTGATTADEQVSSEQTKVDEYIQKIAGGLTDKLTF